MTQSDIDTLAEKLYNFGALHESVRRVDAIVALGNLDLRLASEAARLWHSGVAPVVVASGGIGRLTPKSWAKPEAVVFANELYRAGVAHEAVIVEAESTNLPENIKLSIAALKMNGKSFQRIVLVALPFAERRVLALCKKQFADSDISLTSPNVSYADFPNKYIDKEEAINLIVGELDRLRKFPAKGFSVAEDVPGDILVAIDLLLNEGYDKYRFE